MNKIASFFDSIAIKWNSLNRDYKIIENIINNLDIKTNDSVLDLGCGTGIISNLVSNKSKKEVIALDFSTEMINIAKKNNTNKKIKFLCQDYYLLDKYHFDKIICFDAYPHFIDIERFKTKSYELLNNLGKLIIVFDINTNEINKCHEGIDFTLSRNILKPSKEALFFRDYFKIIHTKEKKNLYLIILEKK